ncbi:MAG: hypothetical protein AAFU85_33065 [Planctomycetota bacterium]
MIQRRVGQYSISRLMGAVTLVGMTIAYGSYFAPLMLDPGPGKKFRPLLFLVGLAAGLGAAFGTLVRERIGAITGFAVGAFIGWLLPIVVMIARLVYLIAADREIMPVPN